jgi:Ser-tRNA(Ala) deacylase AlaX
MSSIPAFDRDPYLKELDSDVLEVGLEKDRPFALLEDTILYPEGGGQPADRGFLGSTEVVDVQKRNGEIRHYLAAPVAAGAVKVKLDWARRFDHMQQHTGQHLLTAVAQERFGWETTAFHLGEARCDIELAAPTISPDEMNRLEEAVAAEIRAGRAVAARHVQPEEYASLKVRSRGLPEGHRGEIRLVEIEGLDLNTCGGTHLRSTAELELMKLLGSEPIRGGTRLFFVAGGRARRRMGEHEGRNAALRTLLGAPDEELVASVAGKLEQLKAGERRSRALEEQLADALAKAWAADPAPVQDHHLEGQDGAFLGRVARALVVAAPGKRLFLTGERDGQTAFVVAAGAQETVDLPALGATVAALLEGRGGGRAPIFQGKAGSLKARDRASEAVRSGG